MKWTTANLKNPNYTENHEIYVGTHTGSFKKLSAANVDNPFQQQNLCDVSKLNKDSKITALEFADLERTEILIGRGDRTAQLHSLCGIKDEQRSLEFMSAPVVGLARYNEHLVGGFGTGQVQRLPLIAVADAAPEPLVLMAGDDMSHMRQCVSERKLVATGGKGRQNNLKVFNLETNTKVFSSKNLPNDYLQLEVPVWDCDLGFIDSNTIATCSRYGYVRIYDIRKQRRPVQAFATEERHSSFATLVARDNYIYTGTTVGVLKAFDTRHMKNFVHTYKGFTGSISDVQLDETGKFLASASLDRYVRVHHVDSCVLLYQCYVKSKATRVLIRNASPNGDSASEVVEDVDENEEELENNLNNSATASEDEEYDEIFSNMQTVCESDEKDLNATANKAKTTHKRKLEIKENKNKRKLVKSLP